MIPEPTSLPPPLPAIDIDTPGRPQEPIPPVPKDQAVFKTAHEIKQLTAMGQSRETLIATLVLIGRDKDALIERVEKLEGKLDSESKERELSQRSCAVLEERLGSPAILLAGILTLLSTILFVAFPLMPQGYASQLVFGGAIMAGLASCASVAFSCSQKSKGK